MYTTFLISLFYISNPIVSGITFSGPNNAKYLVPSETLIDPSTLLNLIDNGFAVIQLLYEML